EATGFWSELGEGIAHIRRRRALSMAVGSLCAVVFIVFMFDTLSPLALRSLGVSVSQLGLAVAGIGAGAVVGTIAIGQFGRRANPFALIGSAEAVTGALVALMGIAIVVSLGAPAVV